MKCQRENCNVEFTPKNYKQMYCSRECLRNADANSSSRYNIVENSKGETLFNVDLYFQSVVTI